MHEALPLLRHPIEEPTAFTPEALLQAVRAERGMGSKAVPPVCLLDFDGDVTDWLVASRLAARCTEWACFHTHMFSFEVDGRGFGLVPRTIGGPYAVLVAEQLAASGAKVILGLTSAGRVNSSLALPSFVVPTSALRDEGTSYHYLAPGATVDAPAMGLIAFLHAELERLGRPVREGAVWTTDAPYRETRRQLEEHANAGILAVEMQTASLFAFAQARGVALGVVAHVTNALDDDGESFDKGTHEEEYGIIQAMCRAGTRFLSERAV
jgi:uridine phosphorylase